MENLCLNHFGLKEKPFKAGYDPGFLWLSASRKAARGDSGYGSQGGYSSRSSSRGPREMFTATCAGCGREAQVPFRPSGDKPVYCSDCFSQRRGY